MLVEIGMIVPEFFSFNLIIGYNPFGSISHFFFDSTCVGCGIIVMWHYLSVLVRKQWYIVHHMFDIFLVVQDLKGFHKSLVFLNIWIRNQDICIWALFLEGWWPCIDQLLHFDLKTLALFDRVPYYSHSTFGWYSLKTKLLLLINYRTLAFSAMQVSKSCPISPYGTLMFHSGCIMVGMVLAYIW